MKKENHVFRHGFSLVVITPGFEPGTVCLEGRCSIQLSYVTGNKLLYYVPNTGANIKHKLSIPQHLHHIFIS